MHAPQLATPGRGSSAGLLLTSLLVVVGALFALGMIAFRLLVGETYLRMGDEARAKELYAKALAVQPDYGNAKEARRIVEGKAN